MDAAWTTVELFQLAGIMTVFENFYHALPNDYIKRLMDDLPVVTALYLKTLKEHIGIKYSGSKGEPLVPGRESFEGWTKLECDLRVGLMASFTYIADSWSCMMVPEGLVFEQKVMACMAACENGLVLAKNTKDLYEFFKTMLDFLESLYGALHKRVAQHSLEAAGC